MVYFTKIHLSNFRNFLSYELNLNKNCNIFYGKNGSGKTNILESLSLFGRGRGFRNDKIKNLINISSEKFSITSDLNINNNTYNLILSSEIINNKHKKKILINDDDTVETKKYLETHLSFIYFLPEMERMFVSSPSNRRNFIDKLIFSTEKKYNQIINSYKKNILERYKILNSSMVDDEWLNKIEYNIANISLQIYKFRNNQINILTNYLNKIEKIIGKSFNITINLDDSFFSNNLNIDLYMSNLKETRKYDKTYGGSKIGPHKSDFIFYTKDNFLVSQLSTGQQKTIVLLLIFAQIQYLINEENQKPIVLFDEICSHLDELNRSILQRITLENDIQFFMTGTSKTLFSFLSTNTNFYNIIEK